MNCTAFKAFSLSIAFTMVLSSVAWAGGDTIGGGVTVRPIESTSMEEKFQSQILYRALEELGYVVGEPFEVDYQTIHLIIGSGDGDFTAAHWDPIHLPFYEDAGGDASMSKVGEYIAGAIQGYLVDMGSYNAGITNLRHLKDPKLAARFDTDGDGRADLAGCVPGWGCERVIEHHLTEYKLRDTVTHNRGIYNTIIGETIARHADGKAVIYYAWMPYWLSGVLIPGQNVQWLEVPYSSLPDNRKENTKFDGKNLGFAVNSVRVVANNDFLAANPAAAKLFEVMAIDISDVSVQNKKMRDGEGNLDDIARHAAEWIASNRARFDSWLSVVREFSEDRQPQAQDR
jgi:glycine betaine/proline transport system substrate-binding protein